jgi:DNA repair exonuclease SbcCD ATPase subunit
MKHKALILIVTAELLAMPLVLLAGNDDFGSTEPRSEGRDRSKLSSKRADKAKSAPRRQREGRDGMGEKEIEEVMAFLKNNLPELHERMERLRETNKRRFHMMMRRMWPRMRDLMNLPQEVRQAHIRDSQLKIKVFRAARNLQEADTTEQKNKYRKQLQKLLAEQFDVEQKVRQYRLKQLEEQLDHLKKNLEQREKDRDKIIADRLKRLANRRRPVGDTRKRRHKMEEVE